MDSIIGILGIAVGIAGLLIAYLQFDGKKKLERFSKATLQGMAGDIAKIHRSSTNTVLNLRDALNTAVLLPETDHKPALLKFLTDGYGDAYATDRSIVNLFNGVITMQEAQFDTRIIKHPERNELDLYKKEQAQIETAVPPAP
jgi:hypothetical protein